MIPTIEVVSPDIRRAILSAANDRGSRATSGEPCPELIEGRLAPPRWSMIRLTGNLAALARDQYELLRSLPAFP